MAPPKKNAVGFVKLQVPAGQANPAPPVGTALGPHGVNIMDFCKQFNSQTQNQPGMIIPVELTIYKDRSFTFITKTPPAAVLLKKAAGLASAANNPGSEIAGEVTKAQVLEIAKLKMPDLNCEDVQAAVNTVLGTARSMGVEVGS